MAYAGSTPEIGFWASPIEIAQGFCWCEEMKYRPLAGMKYCLRQHEIPLRGMKYLSSKGIEVALLRNAIQIWLLLEEKLAALAD